MQSTIRKPSARHYALCVAEVGIAIASAFLAFASWNDRTLGGDAFAMLAFLWVLCDAATLPGEWRLRRIGLVPARRFARAARRWYWYSAGLSALAVLVAFVFFHDHGSLWLALLLAAPSVVAYALSEAFAWTGRDFASPTGLPLDFVK